MAREGKVRISLEDKLTPSVKKAASEAKKQLDSMAKESSKSVDKMSGSLSEAAKGIKGIGSSNLIGGIDTLTKSFKGLMVVGLAIAAAKIFEKMMNSSMEYADSIRKLSIQTSLTTDEVQKWSYVARMNKSSLESISKGFTQMAQQAYNAANGSKTMRDSFDKLGVSIKDGNGNLRKQSDLTNDVIMALSRHTNSTEQAAIAQQLLGRAGRELLPTLRQGEEAIKKQMDAASEYGQILSESTIKKLEDASDASSRLQTAQKVLSAEIMGVAAPAFTVLTNAATEAIAAFKRFMGVAKESAGDTRSADLETERANLEAQLKMAEEDAKATGKNLRDIVVAWTDASTGFRTATYGVASAELGIIKKQLQESASTQKELTDAQIKQIEQSSQLLTQARISAISDEIARERAALKDKYDKLAADFIGNEEALKNLQSWYIIERKKISDKDLDNQIEAHLAEMSEANKYYKDMADIDQQILDLKKQLSDENERILSKSQSQLSKSKSSGEDNPVQKKIAETKTLYEQLFKEAQGNEEALKNLREARSLDEKRLADELVEYNKEKAEEDFQNKLNSVSNYLSAASQVMGQIQSINDIVAEKQLSDLDAETEKRKSAAKASIKNKQEYEKAISKIDADDEKRRKEIAKRDKQIALIQAIINTAVGVTQAIAQGGVAGIVTGALVAAAGAVSIATIASQAFATGGVVKQEPGKSSSGDQHLIRANPRERVLTEKQNYAYERGLSGGINIGGANIVIYGNADRQMVEEVVARSREEEMIYTKKLWDEMKSVGMMPEFV